MRRGNVDKTSRRKTGNGENFAIDTDGRGESAAGGNLGIGSPSRPGGFKGMTSPNSALGI